MSDFILPLHAMSATDKHAFTLTDSDVEKIFEKGEEGMKDAEGFIKQMVSYAIMKFSG